MSFDSLPNPLSVSVSGCVSLCLSFFFLLCMSVSYAFCSPLSTSLEFEGNAPICSPATYPYWALISRLLLLADLFHFSWNAAAISNKPCSKIQHHISSCPLSPSIVTGLPSQNCFHHTTLSCVDFLYIIWSSNLWRSEPCISESKHNNP